MISTERNKGFAQAAKRIFETVVRFLRQTFSDKKNLTRFAFATLGVIVTAQLLPGISIASFWVASSFVIIMVVLLIAAKPTLESLKIPFNIVSFGIFLCLANWLVLMLLDWMLWYFETDNIWWVLAYSAIQAVFNCIIENLVEEE
jgi:putative membrane protein